MATTTSGALTPAQLTAIRNDVTANSDLNALPRNDDGFFAMAALYNVQASPSFTVWKTAIPVDQLGAAIDATEMDNLTQLKILQLQTMLMFGPVDASLANRRAFFAKVFSGANGTITVPALTALSKRVATRIEKLLSTGTGSDAVPATMGFEGRIDRQDLAAALAN